MQTPFSSIAEILHKAIGQHPERPALVLPDRSFSYSQLSRLISGACLRLKEHLDTPGGRIAIIGNNHPAYVVAYFAAQYLGISTVEVGRQESLHTLLDIIKTTRTSFVLTDRYDLKAALEQYTDVESFLEFLSSCEKHYALTIPFPKISASLDGSKEASIIYTSGTTGSPKGVILSHDNFCFIASIVADYLKLDQDDLYALILPLSHTYGKSVMLSSFAAGAALVLLENFHNLPEFLGQLADIHCTILSLVPYHAHVLLKWGNFSKYDLSSLRAITSSGNKLPPPTIDLLNETLPEVQIFSMYGLTESTTRACYVPPDLLAEKKDSCGKPLPGVNIKITGEAGTTLPTGETGEVLLSGPNIMKGYYADPEQTAETLVDGWLKTGDLGHLDEDGFLYLKGRKKDIIKCAGERISAVEIEEVLMEHTGVAEAAVIASTDPMLGEIVHAYVVAKNTILKEADLRTYCAKMLSHHKIPRRYTFVEKLPKNSTGKVQKHLLNGV